MRATIKACSLIAAMMLLQSPRTWAANLPAYDHVVVVIEENESVDQIIGNSLLPYINFLANNGVNFTNSFAIEHPSEPNYLDLFSGSNQGVTDDGTYDVPPFTTPNLGASLIANGRTFGGYSESLPCVGFTGSSYSTDPDLNQYVLKAQPRGELARRRHERHSRRRQHAVYEFSRLKQLRQLADDLVCRSERARRHARRHAAGGRRLAGIKSRRVRHLGHDAQ